MTNDQANISLGLIYSLSALLALLVPVLLYLLLNWRSPKVQLEIADRSGGQLKEERDSAQDKDGSSVLNPAVFRSFSLLKIIDINYNTKIFRFLIPFSKPLGLPIGRHISVRAEINGTKVIRAYTPTSKPDQRGYFDLMVKAYEFGKLSSYLHTLKVGDSLEVRGPIGRFKYEKNAHKCIGLIAGGTGLTPCLQVLRCVLEGPADDLTRFVLYFQNRNERDILLRDELGALVAKHPDRVSLTYFLGNSQSETFGRAPNEVRGYISAEAVQAQMRPQDCSLVCICGPSGFNDAAKKLLEAAGHSENSIYIW